jgi:hypothetical protein
MATQLTLQEDMAAPSFAAADAAGNTWDNSTGQVYLWVLNQSGDSLTVTVSEVRTCSFGHTAQDFTASIGGGIKSALGPFDIMRFNSSDRKATATYSPTATGVTVAAVKA